MIISFFDIYHATDPLVIVAKNEKNQKKRLEAVCGSLFFLDSPYPEQTSTNDFEISKRLRFTRRIATILFILSIFSQQTRILTPLCTNATPWFAFAGMNLKQTLFPL